jgi:hypothetical protein
MDFLRDFYRETEAWALGIIRSCQESIALMAQVRERYLEDWEIEELTRSIMFDEAQAIESLRKGAENARAASKELERV